MISIVQGDDKTLTFKLKTSTGAAYDLTDCTLLVTVKKEYTDLDAAALISGTLTALVPGTGVAYWYIVPTNTKYMLGLYKYDIQLKTAAGLIQTLIVDDFLVTNEITIRVV